MSFMDYIDMHYMHGSPKFADYDRDMQLPFKTSADFVFISLNASISNHLVISIDQPVFMLKQTKSILSQQNALSCYLANIWQPPKSC